MIKWGPPSHFQQQLVTFVVIDCPAAYNIILNRPTLNMMKAQIHTFCNDMIVSSPSGSWIIPGDLPIPLLCYYTGVQSPKLLTNSTDELELNMTHINQFEEFANDATHPERKICHGASLPS